MTRGREQVAAPGDWAERGACLDRHAPDMVVYENSSPTSVEVRRAVCRRCVVLAECRAWALTSPDPASEMMAGGLTMRERSKIRRAARRGDPS